MLCAKCGKQLLPSWKFCSVCGTPVGEEDPADTSTLTEAHSSASAVPKTLSESRQRWNSIFAGILVILFLYGGYIIATEWIMDPFATSQATGTSSMGESMSWQDRLDPNNWSESDLRTAKFVVLAFVALNLGVLIAGLTGNVVIWYDRSDFVISLLMVVTGIVGPLVAFAFFAEDTAVLTGILVASAIIIAILALMTLALSIRYNRSVVVGLVVGQFKLLISLFTLLFVWLLFAVMGNERSTRTYDRSGRLVDDPQVGRDSVSALVKLGFAGTLLYLLINGQRVYEKKGWA